MTFIKIIMKAIKLTTSMFSRHSRIRAVFLLVLITKWITLPAEAQISLEQVYNNSLTSTKINQTEYKYYLMDVTKSECRIYNMDHSLWKTISVKLPLNYYLYDIKFVTQNLFNSDNAVEFWYSAYEWVSTGTATGYYRYISKIIDENGTEVASVTGGAVAYIIQTGDKIYKLAVYAYDNSISPGTVKTYIYSIPGQSTAAFHVVAITADPYPNPASGYINLPVSGNFTEGTLQVFSINGQLITEKKLSGVSSYRLMTSGWTPGIYTYRMTKNGITSQPNPFVVKGF
jgi:hypothetical protein